VTLSLDGFPDATQTAVVLSVDLIRHSVSLYPKWGGSVPTSWTSENVLDECQWFLLNPFKDNHMYFNMG
jgi:hypothetical protein